MKNLLLFILVVFIFSGCAKEQELASILVEPTFTVETVEQIQENGEILSRYVTRAGHVTLDLNLAARGINPSDIRIVRVRAEVINKSLPYAWTVELSAVDRAFLSGDDNDDIDPPNGCGNCSLVEILTVGIDSGQTDDSILRISNAGILLNDGTKIPIILNQDIFTIR